MTTRAEVARFTNIGRTRVGQVIGDLGRLGIVLETSPPPDHRRHIGRPGTLLRIAPFLGFAVGVNITHTDVRVLTADLAHDIISRDRVELPGGADADTALDVIETTLRSTAERAGIKYGQCLGIGVALPGPVDPATHQATPSSISPAWVGTPVAERLQERFDLPVYVDNHGNLAVLAERLWGRGRDCDDFIYLSLDYGIGGGIASHGHLLVGASGMAGELGHITVDPDGTICRCGNRGCLETVAGMEALFAMLEPAHGDKLTLDGVLELLEQGNPAALRAARDIGTVIGGALATLVNVLNPAMIIVGGSLSRAGAPLLDAISAEIRLRALPAPASMVTVEQQRLKGSEMLGAAAAVITDPALVLSKDDRGRAAAAARMAPSHFSQSTATHARAKPS